MERYTGAYNGIFAGVVTGRPGGAPDGVYVIVPRLNNERALGPCEVIGGVADGDATYRHGDRVLVATIGGVKDALAIVGRIRYGTTANASDRHGTPLDGHGGGSASSVATSSSAGTACPFATQKILSYNGAQPARADSATLVLHTNGGGSPGQDTLSLYDYFNGSSDRIAAHFQIMNDGMIEQYLTIDRQAYAAYSANAFAVHAETQDNGNPARPWTPAQVASIIRLAKWIGCPPRPSPDGPGGGVGWHQQYPDWNHDRHECPGSVRRAQILSDVIPALRS